jgi:hypothetical protein
MKALIAGLAVLVLAGCASKPVQKQNIAGLPVTLPLAMCAEHGTVAVSKGNEGERMLCERTAPIGTHLPYCICRDEGMVAQQTEDTQFLIQTIEKNVQLVHGN